MTKAQGATCLQLAQLQLGEDTRSQFTTKLGKMNKEKQANNTTVLRVMIYAKAAQPPCFQAQLCFQKKRKPQLNVCCSTYWVVVLSSYSCLPSARNKFPHCIHYNLGPLLRFQLEVPQPLAFSWKQHDSFTHIESQKPCMLCDKSDAINQFYESIWLA